jgi:ADP-L-glycero-D-manno-heptose 6-epimerase
MILVTGGAGFIGSNIIAGLNERGIDGIAVCDFAGGEKWRNLAKRRYREVVDPGDLEPWLSGRKLEVVLHLGGISSTTASDERLVMDTNFELPMRLLEWCAAARTPFIYASSAATYGSGSNGFADDDAPEALRHLQPLNLYGRSKARFDIAVAERAGRCLAMPPHWAGVKYFNVFGPNEYHKGDMRSVVCKMFPVARSGGAVRLFRSDRPEIPDGGHIRDFVYVKDAVAATLWLAEHGEANGIYNVGSGEGRSFNDLALALFAALGLQPKIEYFQMPAELVGRYQYRTEARMERLLSAGYDGGFASLEAAVEDYVTGYLDRDDQFL